MSDTAVIDRLRAQVERSHAREADTRAELDTVIADRNRLRKEVDLTTAALRTRTEAAEARMVEMEEEIEGLHEANSWGDDAESTIAALHSKLAAMDADANRLREASSQFITRIEAIHDDPLYRAVWESAANHGIDYSKGPKYDEELAHLRAALTATNPTP